MVFGLERAFYCTTLGIGEGVCFWGLVKVIFALWEHSFEDEVVVEDDVDR